MAATALPINRESRDYLARATWLPLDLQAVLEDQLARTAPGRAAELLLEAEVAVQLGDALSLRLAKAGFDSDYAPNEEGIQLERLIDALADATG